MKYKPSADAGKQKWFYPFSLGVHSQSDKYTTMLVVFAAHF